MSRLARDRKALRWSRYARRNAVIAGHVRGSKGEYAALAWIIKRRVCAGKWRKGALNAAMRLFYGM